MSAELFILFLLKDQILPVFGREGSAFPNKEPVTCYKVKIGNNHSNRLHDIPGQVEIDEVMKQSYFCNDKVSKPSYSSLRFLAQFILNCSYVQLNSTNLLLNYLQQLLKHQLFLLQFKTSVHYIFHKHIHQPDSSYRVHVFKLFDCLTNNRLKGSICFCQFKDLGLGKFDERIVVYNEVELLLNL
jgi:hypothetical protein